MNRNPVNLVVISGRSGSGKSVALHSLEDLGYYCIDNLPVMLLDSLINIAQQHYPKLAVSVDARNLPADINDLSNVYKKIRESASIRSTIIYIDADDQVLIKRYAETRRIHPLSKRVLSLDEAVAKETDLLGQIAAVADLRIDTTNSTVHDLATQVVTCVQGNPDKELMIIFESFGYKNGMVKDADFVFDSRFLPNPFWKKELRAFNGLSDKIRDFFAAYPEVEGYICQIDNLLMTWIPVIAKSNRSYLTVAIGCTGGFHRSVYIAQELYDRFTRRGYLTKVRHRSLEKTAGQPG